MVVSEGLKVSWVSVAVSCWLLLLFLLLLLLTFRLTGTDQAILIPGSISSSSYLDPSTVLQTMRSFTDLLLPTVGTDSLFIARADRKSLRQGASPSMSFGDSRRLRNTLVFLGSRKSSRRVDV